jgi:DNA invertase Pin-like site-specific DNA recombinase
MIYSTPQYTAVRFSDGAPLTCGLGITGQEGRVRVTGDRDSCGIYLRISDDREGRELGVGRQEQDCLQLAARLRCPVHDVYKDNDISASTRSRKARPEYQRLLADARAGHVATVIAYTSGRLTRRPREHEDLIELAERHGVRFRLRRLPVL